MDFQHELIIPNEDIPCKLFLFEGDKGNYIREKHWHNAIEIFAVFEGELEFNLNGTSFTLKNGEFVLVNSNVVHSIYAKKANKTVVLQIPLRLFEKYTNADHIIEFTCSDKCNDDVLMQYIENMYSIYCSKECGYDLKVQSLLFNVLYLLVTSYREDIHESASPENRSQEKLHGITDYIKSHYYEDITLKHVAELFGYSPAYLSRMFQKYAHINYKDYVQAVRTEHGYNQLLSTNKSIADISLDSGFPNIKSFSKSFLKIYGMKPGEFRKSQKNAINQLTK